MDYSDHGVLQQLFVDSLPDCALILLDVDGQVLTWNAGAQAIHGYLESEMVGRHFSCLYTQSDIDAAKPSTWLASALTLGRHEETCLRRRKDGTELEVQDVLIPLYDPQGRLVAFGNLAREVGRSTSVAATQGIAQGLTMVPADVVPIRRSKKVLLVDDDAAVREAAADMLTGLGYQVVAASNGAEALDMLERFADIDVLFTDVVMPGGMDGGQLAEKARQLRPDVKILFASGYFEGALVREGNIAPNTQFLVKPYRKKDLAHMMEEVLGSKVSPAAS